ncbi:MAG: glycosyltransferase family 4 protein [bacterium]
MMRIGIDAISFAFEFSGVARYLMNMLEAMVAISKSDEFIIYSPMPINLSLPGKNWCFRIKPGWLSHRPTLWTQFVLPRLLLEDKIDVFWAQPTNMPLRLKHRCLRVLTLHDLVPYISPESMQLNSLVRMRLLLRSIVRVADIVICVSDTTAQLAARYFDVDGDKFKVIKEGVAPVFRRMEKEEARAIVKERFDIEGEYLIFVSTIEPRKDHLTLLRAIKILPEAPLLVLVGGKGWRSKPIFSEIEKFKKAGKIKYLGRVSDDNLRALYSAARLSVYPSRYEGFGLPVLEAMACGCPVLCSDSSSLTEVGGKAAFYFRTGDHQDLAARLKELLGDNQRLAAMADAGLERVKRFSFNRAAKELLAIFKERSGGV